MGSEDELATPLPPVAMSRRVSELGAVNPFYER
jgi:hypothetical protein